MKALKLHSSIYLFIDFNYIAGEPNNYGGMNEDCIGFGSYDSNNESLFHFKHTPWKFQDIPCSFEVFYPMCMTPAPSKVQVKF